MKVLKIEEIDYKDDVYNLHIKGNHNYYANGLLVHNCHRFASEETSDIIKNLKNTTIRLGFTGTLPDNKSSLMMLLGLFGQPNTLIRSSELIERGLGTPIKINSIIFEYPNEDRNILRNCSNYQSQLKMIKEYPKRNELIEKLSIKLLEKGQNSLVLFSHTEHGKSLFKDVYKKLFNISLENKNIVGKKSFDFQKEYGIYFVNGEDDAKTREMTRKILEEEFIEVEFGNTKKIFNINDTLSLNNTEILASDLKIGDEVQLDTIEKVLNIKQRGAILFSNYSILSTGVNIKQLHNMIFASPLKSYTTITQSIGRGMRLHKNKKEFNVYDLVDDLGIKKPSGVFWKQYIHRLQTSYNPEGYQVIEKRVLL